MEDKIKKLLEWSTGKKVGPLSIEIWPTNRCNLKCAMCGTWASRRRLEKAGVHYNPQNEINSELSDERVIEIIKESIELGAKNFLITGGGEPFVRRDATLKMILEIKKHSLFGNLNTNGTLISDEDALQIVKMEWDIIMFSVDGHNAEVHNYIKNVSGSFEKVVETLKKFKELKKEFGFDKPKIVFNTVVTNKNYNNLFEIIEFASTVGCEDITFIPLIVYDEYIKSLGLDETQNSEFYNLIPSSVDKSKELGINTNLEDIRNQFIEDTTKMDDVILSEIKSLPGREFASLPCFQPFLHLLIKPDGEVTCCCMVDSLKDNLKNKSLKEIWYGKKFEYFRNKFLEKELPEDCKTCVFSQFVRNKELRTKLSEIL